MKVLDICKQFVRVLVVVFGIIAQYPRQSLFFSFLFFSFRLSDLQRQVFTLWIQPATTHYRPLLLTTNTPFFRTVDP